MKIIPIAWIVLVLLDTAVIIAYGETGLRVSWDPLFLVAWCVFLAGFAGVVFLGTNRNRRLLVRWAITGAHTAAAFLVNGAIAIYILLANYVTDL